MLAEICNSCHKWQEHEVQGIKNKDSFYKM